MSSTWTCGFRFRNWPCTSAAGMWAEDVSIYNPALQSEAEVFFFFLISFRVVEDFWGKWFLMVFVILFWIAFIATYFYRLIQHPKKVMKCTARSVFDPAAQQLCGRRLPSSESLENWTIFRTIQSWSPSSRSYRLLNGVQDILFVSEVYNM